MEKALIVNRLDDLEEYHSNGYLDGFDRIYFGHEFCQRLMPSADDVIEALRICEDARVKFTLLTPYVDTSGEKMLLGLIDRVAEIMDNNEVIVNDFGIFHAFKRKILSGHLKVELITGRLLMAQTRYSQNMFKSFGIRRTESDLWEHAKCFRASKTSLYYPYTYITTTRACPTAGCCNSGDEPRFGIIPCRKECLSNSFAVENPNYEMSMYLSGNTQFRRQDDLPDEETMLYAGVDRLVFQAKIPI